MKNVFVNEAFTIAINDYLNSKNNTNGVKFNSFMVVVIRLLMIIYDELDILNPFYLNNEQALNDNLEKYGYNYISVDKFKKTFQNYYENENSEDFINLQKMLIDMFALKNKTMEISKDIECNFKDLLYTPNSSNMLIISYNYLMAKDPNEIENYFSKVMESSKYHKPQKPKKTLNIDAYEILKYSLEDINKLSADELDEVNKKVYNYFDINENAINKDYLLDKAVYDYKNPKPALSSGNGYVDILLVLSIVATLGLAIFLLTIFVF